MAFYVHWGWATILSTLDSVRFVFLPHSGIKLSGGRGGNQEGILRVNCPTESYYTKFRSSKCSHKRTLDCQIPLTTSSRASDTIVS